MIFFWILWGIDAIAALVVLCFFFIGLTDKTVSATNMGLWLLILIALAAILGGSLWLKSHDYRLAAKIVAAILAAPAFLYALFMAIVLFSGARWN